MGIGKALEVKQVLISIVVCEHRILFAQRSTSLVSAIALECLKDCDFRYVRELVLKSRRLNEMTALVLGGQNLLAIALGASK